MKRSLRLGALLLCAFLLVGTGASALAASNVTVTKRTMKEETKTYLYKIEYPRTKIEVIDKAVEEFVEEQLDGFLDTMEEYAYWNGTPSALYLEFKLYRRDAKTVSFLFEKSVYYAGGAHDTTVYHAMNFDTETGELIDVGDLFVEGWEEELAKLCEKPLLKAMDAKEDDESILEWIRKGLKEEEAFDSIVLTKTGVRIAFDDYQVGPYAAGAPVIYLANRTIDSILK